MPPGRRHGPVKSELEEPLHVPVDIVGAFEEYLVKSYVWKNLSIIKVFVFVDCVSRFAQLAIERKQRLKTNDQSLGRRARWRVISSKTVDETCRHAVNQLLVCAARARRAFIISAKSAPC